MYVQMTPKRLEQLWRNVCVGGYLEQTSSDAVIKSVLHKMSPLTSTQKQLANKAKT